MNDRADGGGGGMNTVNLVSISGGKDSTAMALIAAEKAPGSVRFVFADTGHEHPVTYKHVNDLSDELERRVGQPIQWVRADFTRRIENKRQYITEKWPEKGVSQDQIDRALNVLQPTGNPMLDLCLWKGRFPSTRARFCSQELKHIPIHDQMVEPLLDQYRAVVSWQGVRRDESRSRSELPERDVEFGQWEPEPKGLLIYRPILDYTADDVFDLHRRHGVRWNPLYEQGMGRVGCMPCIHARKDELNEIAHRFPEFINRIREWERLVSDASKRGAATFFATSDGRGDGIDEVIEWAKTSRGGQQQDMLRAMEPSPCSSIYGLCE